MARNLNFCFTKIKSLQSPEHNLQENHSHPFPNPSPSLLIKNFNSLYENFNAAASENQSPPPDSGATTDSAAMPDFTTAFASRRFFFSSPGRSNSIIDSSSSLASTSSSTSLNLPPENDTVSSGSIAVPTYSPDPFMDFRRSMQEMVEAREIDDVRENWDYLHELLMCYLSLNPKSTHKYIVGAFADLLVSLMTSPPENSRRKTPIFPDGKCKIPPQYM
ncbi:hypothetical protein ABFS82_04G030100 [Erythranthe guttata]|uniref:Transcription repressor n=1 Tax=Erythranthe guttata TaxID=4155 RepID=A0A022S3Q9_ERYGU|nr:PREDICTED: transcription repressor OFP16-like [Erythranthe guttata]EYU46568.1 hypothetical protein MIMGU_mgv1a013517mg [Erythranthe guttata]|eukprot:XP_012837203.1 PREDICTED: transcription repressor OFP16-like [Erythranthe guttata]